MKKRISALAAILIAIPAFAACSSDATTSASTSSTGAGGGGSTSAGAGGGGTIDAKWFCEHDIARAQKCNETPPDEATCEQQQACLEAIARDGALGVYWKCVAERDCMTSDDPCAQTAADAVPETATTMKYGTDCKNRLSACEQANTPFHDDFCFAYQVYSDAILQQLDACFAKSCDQVTDCLDGVVAAASPSCQ